MLAIPFTIFIASCGQQAQEFSYEFEKAKTPTREQLSIMLPPILYKAVGKSPSSSAIKKWKVRANEHGSYNYESQCGETLINLRPPPGDFWLDCPEVYTIERLLNVSQLYNFLADIVYETTINITNGLDASELTLNRNYSGEHGSSNVYYEKYDEQNGINDCIDKFQLTASYYRVTVGSAYSIKWCIYSDGSVEGNYYAAGYANFDFSSNDSATIKSIFIVANNAFGEDFGELPRPDNTFRPLEKVSKRDNDEIAFRRDHGPWTMSVNYVDNQWMVQYGQELQLYLPCPWERESEEYDDNCNDEGYEGQYAAPKSSVLMVSMIAEEPSTHRNGMGYSSDEDNGIAAMNVIAVDSDNDKLEGDAKNVNNIWDYRNKLYSEHGLNLPTSATQSNPIYLYDENNIHTGGETENLPTEISFDVLDQLDYTNWISKSPASITNPQF